MRTNKIIAVFIVIIVAMIGGYFAYSHYQKVSLAQYYYDIGNYKKASDLDAGEISTKAQEIENASNWTMHKTDPFMLYTTISSIYLETNILKPDDKKFINIMESYYQNIASYLGVTTTRLDEICKLYDSKVEEEEIRKLIRNRK